MNQNIIAASIIAFALIVAGVAQGGRYYATNLGQGRVAVLDRWTGKVSVVDTNPETKSEWSPEVFLKKTDGS